MEIRDRLGSPREKAVISAFPNFERSEKPLSTTKPTLAGPDPAAGDAAPIAALERAPTGGPQSWIAACAHLFGLTLRRQLLSRQTVVGLALGLLCCLIVVAWSRNRESTAERFAERLLVPTFIGFLLPVLAISYGGSGVGGEREDGTLIYLLISPIPRPLVYATKFLATALLVSGSSILTLLALCLLAGESGRTALGSFLAASAIGAVAYGSLFLMLGASFRHGTVISLAYWFFLEVLFGNMPGIIKRISIAFYVRCMIYDAGAKLDLGPATETAREMFLPVSGETAMWTLTAAILSLFVMGMATFTRREYRDLS